MKFLIWKTWMIIIKKIMWIYLRLKIESRDLIFLTSTLASMQVSGKDHWILRDPEFRASAPEFR